MYFLFEDGPFIFPPRFLDIECFCAQLSRHHGIFQSFDSYFHFIASDEGVFAGQSMLDCHYTALLLCLMGL
jgi:hypothetical protein